MSTDGEVRIGLLGTGAITQVVHLPVLTQLSGVRVEAVCDADHSKAAAIASRFGIPRVYRRDEDVFGADDLDAVIVCTPSHLHQEQAIAALESGKHVLVEKPLALDPMGAARVVEAAEQARRTLMVAMNTRYRPDALAVKPFLQGGELGTVFLVKSAWMNRKVRTVRPTWRHRRATAGGGALMDLGVQVLDLCLWLLDYPSVARVTAHAHPGEGMEVEDSAVVLLRLRDGAAISVAASWSLVAERDRHYLRLLATRGSASLAPLAVYKEVEHGLLDVTPQLQPGNENLYTASYRRLLTHFVDCVRGSAVTDLPREQIELMRLVSLAYRSAEEGREIEA
ncbi:MAG TPA: Gfo/Idh/MocA family oxidoreductase [Longimicrobiales bacterium]